jgi:hypothetical protein
MSTIELVNNLAMKVLKLQLERQSDRDQIGKRIDAMKKRVWDVPHRLEYNAEYKALAECLDEMTMMISRVSVEYPHDKWLGYMNRFDQILSAAETAWEACDKSVTTMISRGSSIR